MGINDFDAELAEIGYKAMLKEAVNTIRTTCELMDSGAATGDNLDDACNALAWIVAGDRENFWSLTFDEVCEGLGICPDYSRTIALGAMTGTCLTDAKLRILSRYLATV